MTEDTHMQQQRQPIENFGLSRQPEKAMEEAMARIALLISVYEKETEALERSDSKAFVELQDEKMHAARLYESAAEQMLRRRDEFKQVDTSLKARMATMQESFSALTRRNMEALARMKRSTERLSVLIMNSAKKFAEQNNVISYSGDGALAPNKLNISIGVNQSA